jgi:hypothetical protein
MFENYGTRKREWSQVPFWFWNDELSDSEIVRQLDDFRAHGVHAFVIHPRAGLPRHLGWMSDELLEHMRFAIDHAAGRGMWVILYDEAMYPSGSSGGQVVAEDPAYACRGIVQVDLTTATPGETLQSVKVGASGVELAENQTLVAEVTRQHDGHLMAIVDTAIGSIIRGVHFKENDPARRDNHKEVEENHPLAGDLLNPEAMQCFIRLVYQRYYDEFGSHFGKTIKAIFTDEPGLLGRGSPGNPSINPRPGTTGILEHVNAFLGYDFTSHLPALWDLNEPNAQQHRDDYARAIRHRLQETYYHPISEWCENHGIALTGHPEKSDDIGMLRHFQIPGQDVVLRYVEPGKESALVGPHSTMAKCASSAMRHLGRRRNLNEFAGAYGHDLTFEEYRWLALWLLIRGCNMLSPHAFYYSTRGPRIDERPRDVGPNSPWWDGYKEFADMTGKLCWLNTDSEHLCNIAILGQDDRLPWGAARVCFENQIDFNYLEECFLLRDSDVTEAGIDIGSMHYDLLIVEADYGTTLGGEAEAVIGRLDDAARVLCWSPSEGADALLQAIAKQVPSTMSVTPAHPGLRMRRVRKEGDDYLILFNEGQSPFRGSIRVDGAISGTMVDMDGDETSAWENSRELTMEAHACRVIRWHDATVRT